MSKLNKGNFATRIAAYSEVFNTSSIIKFVQVGARLNKRFRNSHEIQKSCSVILASHALRHSKYSLTVSIFSVQLLLA